MRPSLVLALVLLAGASTAEAPSPDPELVAAKKQVKEGRLEGGILALEAYLRRTAGAEARTRDRADAYVYLGVAYLALDQEAAAKAEFALALVLTPDLTLSRGEFPPRVVRVFELARLEAPLRAAPSPPEHGGRSHVVPILIGAGLALAGGTAAIIEHNQHSSPPNYPPTASFTINPPGMAITGVTVVAFAGTASDPDHDPLTYAWNMGDGANASGPSPTHIYSAEGTFPVVLTVADNRGASVAATGVVSVRSLTGRWLLTGGGGLFYERGYDIVQTGATLAGRPFSVPDKGCLGDLIGLATDPRNIRFQFVGCDGLTVVVSGTVAPDLLSVTGTYAHPTGTLSMSITRQ